MGLLCLVSLDLMAADIKAFTMTDVESELLFRYLFDEQTFFQSESKIQQDTRPTFQEEYRINTRSYVFHPNLLSMELGASLLLDQSRIETLDDSNSNNETLYGLNARLDFLKKKPYPMSFFYNRQNPSISIGLGGRFLQENIKYGTELALLQPISPVQISVNAWRQTINGGGFEQITDDDLGHADIRFYNAYGKGNHAQLTYQVDNRDSRSGSPGLPIQARTTSTTSAYFDSQNLYGDQQQIQLISNISFNTQVEFPRRKELRINPFINWQHNDNLRSFYRINYNQSEEEDNDIKQSSVISGVGYNSKDQIASMDIHAENNTATTIDFRNAGLNYTYNHNRPIDTVNLQFSYSGSADIRDQVSEDALFQIFGEEHDMIGTTPVTLNQLFIDTTTIEVWNTVRTQLFIENIDYRILEIGSQTQIQRLSSGNITDGQTVLMDYSYQTGGTFSYELISNNMQLLWKPSRFYEMYVRYQDSQQNLRDGAPTIQLNSVNSLTYGINADRPLLNGINLGGEMYFVNHREDINPFTFESYDAYIELPLPRLTSLRLSARRQLVDNENSPEDVDLNGYILRLQSRPWLRTRLNYEASYETDTGGSLNRELFIHRLQFHWAFRQLSLLADAYYSEEQQGLTDRERWAITFTLRRTF